MRACIPQLAGAFAAVVLGLCAAPISAVAGPIAGGQYEGDILLADEDPVTGRAQPACRGCITLIAANDGLSFDGGYLHFLAPCADYDGLPARKSVQEWPPETTQIDPMGAFAWTREQRSFDSFTIAGQFSADGRQMEGRLSYIEPGLGCAVSDVAFRAALTGLPRQSRPGRPAVCPGVGARNALIVSRERGVGCTKAKLLVLAWSRERACSRSPSRAPCRVLEFECSGVHGGRYSRQSAVRCVATAPQAGAVEFVVQVGCGYVKSVGLDVVGVNTPCRLARRIARRIRAGCGARVGDRCDVGDDYRCGVTEVTDEWMAGRCRSRRDAFFVVLFGYAFPP